MIKTLIIDDDSFVREDIAGLLSRYFESTTTLLGEARSVETGIYTIDTLLPQLVFLDIELGDGTGFDVLTKCKHKDFDIIFITGYNEHAIKAIKVGALDYLLKPIDTNEFIEAVNKVLEVKRKNNQMERFIEIAQNYFYGTDRKRMIINTTDTIYTVSEEDIIYCKSDGNYTTFFRNGKEPIIAAKSLKQVEELLTHGTFIRCHQSYIVNRDYVVKYQKRNGVLILLNDTKIPVSSRRKDEVLSQLF